MSFHLFIICLTTHVPGTIYSRYPFSPKPHSEPSTGGALQCMLLSLDRPTLMPTGYVTPISCANPALSNISKPASLPPSLPISQHCPSQPQPSPPTPPNTHPYTSQTPPPPAPPIKPIKPLPHRIRQRLHPVARMQRPTGIASAVLQHQQQRIQIYSAIAGA